MQAAGPLGLQSLYHYQDFDLSGSVDHIDRLADVLTKHRVYCSNPATFNDPWDCKPYFDPALLDDPSVREATVEKLISTRTGGPELDPLDERLRADPEFLKEAIHKFSVRLSDFIPTQWGVYCLSPVPTLTLMWSHYARNHRGICLEFAVPNTKFQLAFQVHYQNRYPKLLLHDSDSRLRMLLVKSSDWAYEQEFRLICPRVTDIKELPLTMDGNYLQIGPQAVKSIILGCQIDKATDGKIRDLVREYAPHVRVRQARRALQRYELAIED